MKRCLVIGVNGQDGSFLAEHLLAEGSTVEGWGRQIDSRFVKESPHFRYRQLDLQNGDLIPAAFRAFEPDEIYHVAAVHGASGFHYEPVWGAALNVNTRALYFALEHARAHPGDVRVFYGSSAKVFGGPLQGAVGIDSPRTSDCLYSITKNTSEQLITYYRKHHQVDVAVAVLFNHESSRRSVDYFLPLLCAGIRQIKNDPAHTIEFRTLDFYCDWGSAEEYMALAISSLRADSPATYLLATGHTVYVEDFVRELFEAEGIEFDRHVKIAGAPSSGSAYHVDLSATIACTGALPSIRPMELCRQMIRNNDQLN